MKAFFTSALIIASLSLNAAAYDQDQTVAELMEFTTGLITGLEYNTRGKKRCPTTLTNSNPSSLTSLPLSLSSRKTASTKTSFLKLELKQEFLLLT